MSPSTCREDIFASSLLFPYSPAPPQPCLLAFYCSRWPHQRCPSFAIAVSLYQQDCSPTMLHPARARKDRRRYSQASGPSTNLGDVAPSRAINAVLASSSPPTMTIVAAASVAPHVDAVAFLPLLPQLG
ncbi:hypothetical protein BHE74_00043298 [Ensete ventricosum]|nr:hypothetical protein BHE74_00043298 [Ensete ventricosum]RZS22347.1 hypothetical protein BHM03_00055103 [Ensete ventricosum]